jgi:predicted RNA-binding protein with RPS1 domain
MKLSVIKKKAAKLQEKPVDLYVSKIRLDHGTLEVSSTMPDLSNTRTKSNLIPASTLRAGEELAGIVVDVRSYGCIVDVGANRKGLLHILSVADLYGRYIDKEKGIIDAGLERGAMIKVSIKSNLSKRLLLDFTDDVKESAGMQLTRQSGTTLSNIEAEEWANFIHSQNVSSQAIVMENGIIECDDEYEKDDEDRRIEDAFGLGSY